MAALSLCFALFFPLPAAWAEPATWPGASFGSGLEALDVSLPPNALPPGPATAELLAPKNDVAYRVRLQLPLAPGKRLRLWSTANYATDEQKLTQVRVHSDVGPDWQRSIPSSYRAESAASKKPVFWGSADELARFVASLKVLGPARGVDETTVSRLELRPPQPELLRDCREIVGASVVVAPLGPEQDPAPLLTCAAQGARVVLVQTPAPASIAKLPEGVACLWGAGAIAWAPALDPVAAHAAVQLWDPTHQNTPLHQQYDWINYTFSTPERLLSTETTPDSKGDIGLLVGLLLLYALVIGPVGYWVGIRPRKLWLAWGWFPLVALGTSAVLTLVSSLLPSASPRLLLSRILLSAPDGQGLQSSSIQVQGHYSDSYSLTLAWDRADLRENWHAFHFASPFTVPSGPVLLLEDQERKQLLVQHLAVARHDRSSLGWVSPHKEVGLSLRRRGADFEVRNDTEQQARRALLITQGGWVELQDIPSHQSRVVSISESSQRLSSRTWVDELLGRLNAQRLVPGSFVLAVETESSETRLTVQPEVPVTVRELHMLTGPLPREADQ